MTRQYPKVADPIDYELRHNCDQDQPHQAHQDPDSDLAEQAAHSVCAGENEERCQRCNGNRSEHRNCAPPIPSLTHHYHHRGDRTGTGKHRYSFSSPSAVDSDTPWVPERLA